MADKSNEDFGSIRKYAPGGIFIYSAEEDDQFSYISDNMLRMLGYTKNEFEKKFDNRFSLMVYEEDRQRVLKEIDDQIANGEYDTCEYRIECKDGRLLWVHDEGHIVGEENGRKVFYVVIVENMHDVADREQLGKIRTIIDNIPAGIVVYRARGGRQDFVAANPAACRILETTTDAFVNDEQSIFLKRIHADNVEEVREFMMSTLPDKAEAMIAFRYLSAVGRYKWIRMHVSSKKLGGSEHMIFAALTDITEKRIIDEALYRTGNMQDTDDYSRYEYNFGERTLKFYGGIPEQTGLPEVLTDAPETMLPYLKEYCHEQWLKMFRDISGGKELTSGEFAIVGNESAAVNFYIIVMVPLKDKDGNVESAMGVVKNIAGRKQEQQRYRESLRALLAANPKSLCTFHLNITNNTCTEGFGTSPYIINTLQADTVDDLVENVEAMILDDKYRKKFREHFSRKELIRRFESGEMQSSARYRRRMEDGSFGWVRTTVNMLNDPQTHELEAVMYSESINDKMIDEEIIQHITDIEYDFVAILKVDERKFRFRYLGKVISEIYNYAYVKITDEQDYGKILDYAVDTWVDQEDSARFIAEAEIETMIRNLEDSDYHAVMVKGRHPDGMECWKQIRYHWLDDYRQLILIEQMDVSEMIKRQQQELEERLSLEQKLRLEADRANESKSDFLSNVSHDMRTPLNAILGYNRLALQEKDPEVVHDYLNKIQRAGDTLLDLINDTLDLQKIETGTTTLKPVIVSCSEVIKGIVTAVKPMMDKKNISFTLDNSRAVMANISVDKIRLEEIFINLLSNAAKYTPEGGAVTLVVECLKLEPDCVHDRLTVRDTGIGMSQDFQTKLFEPFSQERTEKTAGIEGSGLGLTIAKRLVDMMGGSISLKSELGRGSEFTILLDFERVENEIQVTDEGVSYTSLAGKRVLLCEDNAMNREIATAILKMKDICVTEAVNGREGTDMFLASEPGWYDAILMDIRMPVMNGYDAAAEIRNSDHPDAERVPIIALTADAYADDAEKARHAGMDGHLTKPLDPDLLYEALLKKNR